MLRYDYLQSPLLPAWIPQSGLFVLFLKGVLDNHFQDTLLSIIYPSLFPNYAYVCEYDDPPQTLLVTLTPGGNVPVTISTQRTDVYDNPLPFALYDGKWLVIFNLHTGSASGGAPASGLPHPLWCDGEVPGTLLTLSDHLVGGRALWRTPGGVWRSATLEERGLFVPGSYASIECRYERRPPYPSASLPDRPLQFRYLWSRGDDVLRLYGMHRHRRSLGRALQNVRGRLPGAHQFGIASELGLVEFVPRHELYMHFTAPAGCSALYGTYLARLLRAEYPNTLSGMDAIHQSGETSVVLIKNLWVDTLPLSIRGELTADVT
ncbi:MAG: hypothetical protein KatS3mg023_3727 [Armatimonadota bacterium]|nr:MAG: hypothetical protein KatS3mg023_3727 [Armatimonadota bacterium]